MYVVLCVENFIQPGAVLRLLLKNVWGGGTFCGHSVYREGVINDFCHPYNTRHISAGEVRPAWKSASMASRITDASKKTDVW